MEHNKNELFTFFIKKKFNEVRGVGGWKDPIFLVAQR